MKNTFSFSPRPNDRKEREKKKKEHDAPYIANQISMSNKTRRKTK